MPQTQTSPNRQLAEPLSENDHFEGSLSAPVRIVEYGDYECPFCGRADQVIKELQQELGDQICYAFRNFPLYQIHEFALLAAQAAEAAALQDKFWEMHDLLYRNQDALDGEAIAEYAQSLGLDMQVFSDAMEDEAVKQRITHDLYTGMQSDVEGTPSFYINGHKYEGNTDLDQLRQAVTNAPSR